MGLRPSGCPRFAESANRCAHTRGVELEGAGAAQKRPQPVDVMTREVAFRCADQGIRNAVSGMSAFREGCLMSMKRTGVQRIAVQARATAQHSPKPFSAVG